MLDDLIQSSGPIGTTTASTSGGGSIGIGIGRLGGGGSEKGNRDGDDNSGLLISTSILVGTTSSSSSSSSAALALAALNERSRRPSLEPLFEVPISCESSPLFDNSISDKKNKIKKKKRDARLDVSL